MTHPYHVAIFKSRMRELWPSIRDYFIVNHCVVRQDMPDLIVEAYRWRVFAFTHQFQAIHFYERFAGMWVLGAGLIRPQRFMPLTGS